MPLTLGDESALEVIDDARDAPRSRRGSPPFQGRDHDVVLRDRDAGERRVVEPERLDRVEHSREHGRAETLDEVGDEVVELLLRFIVRFMNGCVSAAFGSARTSAIERTISSLKTTRPGVVE